MGELIFTFSVGVLFIVVAILVNKNPSLISGYENADETKRDKFVNVFTQAFAFSGMAIIVGGIVCYLLDLDVIAPMICAIFVLFILYILLRTNGLLKNSSKGLLYVLISSLFVISILIVYSNKEQDVNIDDDVLEISGLYGVVVSLKNIREIKLMDEIPHVIFRNNGYAFGEVKKGMFKVEDWGKCRLFLQNDEAPFLLITLVDNQRIILNSSDSKRVLCYYKKLSSNSHQ